MAIYQYTNDLFLSVTLGLKMFPINYFICFGNHYDNLSYPYNIVKPFVRFSDTGFMISILYYFDDRWISIAFNTHFLITSGYWIGKCILGVKSSDDITDHHHINKTMIDIWCSLNHGLSLVLFIYKILYDSHSLKTQNTRLFTFFDLWYSIMWFYAWIVFIYLPWRCKTGDILYSILSKNIPVYDKITAFIYIHVLLGMANSIGYGLSYM